MTAHKRLTAEEVAETVRVWRANGCNQRAAAKAMRRPRSTIQLHLARAAELGIDNIPQAARPPVGFRVSKWSTELDEAGVVSRQFVQTRPEPGEVFEVPPGHRVKGESAYVDAEGRVIGKWVKTTEDRTALAAVAIKEALDGWQPPPMAAAPDPAGTLADILQVYPIADAHIGMLSWGRETGESYDLSLAQARMRASMRDLLAAARPAETGLILNLGDWQHNDDSTNATPTHGNPLDVDGRYAKVLQVSALLQADLIRLALEKHRRVVVRNIPGNHDPHAMAALTLAMSCLFAAEPRVAVLDDPGAWFFWRHGLVLLGATHGDRVKPADMAMNMANCCPEDWGETRFRYFYHGHIHHERAIEVGGVTVESFRSLAPKDAYSRKQGYLAGNSLVGITHHRDFGEVGRQRVNIVPQTARAARAASSFRKAEQCPTIPAI